MKQKQTAGKKQGSEASVQRRLSIALTDNQRLRKENGQLREELSRALGQIRNLQKKTQ